MTRRGIAVCVGALAGLSLACSSGRATERGPGASAQADTTQKSGAGTGSAAANEQAASTRPTEGAGGKDPHPLITDSQQGDPKYGADRSAQAGRPVEQPGTSEGRNARVDRAPDATAGAATAGSAQAAQQPKQPEAQELPEVSGRVTAVTKSELRVQPRDGNEVTLRMDPTVTTIDLDGRQASLTDLSPGTEVRASYEESKGTKHAMAVHAKTGDAATQSR
ncbi:MAG: hypothetical protein ACM3S3_02140 [Candidatus Doudnabacteria bacterium]